MYNKGSCRNPLYIPNFYRITLILEIIMIWVNIYLHVLVILIPILVSSWGNDSDLFYFT